MTIPAHETFEKPSGWIEFELTNVDDAHDTLPEGVDKLPELDPHYWERRRRKPGPTDRALAGFTIDWLISLPPELRPRVLCDQYPRAANLIAEAVPGPARVTVLQQLLGDSRGGRKGFPPAVRRELETVLAAERLGAA
jgi:hypothetical protein